MRPQGFCDGELISSNFPTTIIATVSQIAPSDNQIPRGAILSGDEKESRWRVSRTHWNKSQQLSCYTVLACVGPMVYLCNSSLPNNTLKFHHPSMTRAARPWSMLHETSLIHNSQYDINSSSVIVSQLLKTSHCMVMRSPGRQPSAWLWYPLVSQW